MTESMVLHDGYKRTVERHTMHVLPFMFNVTQLVLGVVYNTQHYMQNPPGRVLPA